LKIHKFLTAFATAALMILAGCVEQPFENVDNTTASAGEDFSYEIPVNAMNHLTLSAVNGPIDVAGISDSRTVRIWGERRVASDSYRDAMAYLDNLSVNISSSSEELMVRTLQPENTHGREYTIVYHMRVPINWNLTISNVNGDIVVDALQGNGQLDVVNGQVRVRDMIGNLDAKTTNGNVDVQMQLPLSGQCKLGTVNGTIDLTVPPITSAQFNAVLVSGKISLSNITLTNQIAGRMSLKGTLADGNGLISLQTVNGNISMHGR
jgi:hypothetical protein